MLMLHERLFFMFNGPDCSWLSHIYNNVIDIKAIICLFSFYEELSWNIPQYCAYLEYFRSF